MLSPSRRALLASSVFAAFGIIGWLIARPSEPAALPLALFYAFLVLHSYFPVREFTAIARNDRVQMVFDAVLVMLYAIAAVSFASPVGFLAAMTALFIVSVGKYLYLARTHSSEALTRKIRWTALGALLIFAACVAALAGFPVLGAWVLAVVYGFFADIYLLYLNPMYRND